LDGVSAPKRGPAEISAGPLPPEKLWIWLLAAGVASFFTSHPTVMVAELNTGGRPSWTRQLHVRTGFDILFRHEKDIV